MVLTINDDYSLSLLIVDICNFVEILIYEVTTIGIVGCLMGLSNALLI